MGQTVVFTVSLDGNDVAIEQVAPRPPDHPFRDAFLTGLRDRRWRIAALMVLVIPAIAAGVTFVITHGEWVSTAFLVGCRIGDPSVGRVGGNACRDGRPDQTASPRGRLPAPGVRRWRLRACPA